MRDSAKTASTNGRVDHGGGLLSAAIDSGNRTALIMARRSNMSIAMPEAMPEEKRKTWCSMDASTRTNLRRCGPRRQRSDNWQPFRWYFTRIGRNVPKRGGESGEDLANRLDSPHGAITVTVCQRRRSLR